MVKNKVFLRYLSISALSVLCAACDNGTSKSSSNFSSTSNTENIGDQPKTNLRPVVIDESNVKSISSAALKSALLSDFSNTAIDTAVAVTRNKNEKLADMATAVVVNLNDIPCAEQGNMTINAIISDQSDPVQLDFENPLTMNFQTLFNGCNQGIATLTGDFLLIFEMLFEELFNYNQYNFEAYAVTNNLTVEQAGFLPYDISGEFYYRISSSDGENSTTEMTAESLYYYADDNYEFSSFESTKDVVKSTGYYVYSMMGELIVQGDDPQVVRYSTIEPMTGTGYTLPVSGILSVEGLNESLLIYILADQTINLFLDLENDGSFDVVTQSTWQELVLNQISIE